MFDEKQLFKSEVDLVVPTLLTYGDAVCSVEGFKLNRERVALIVLF